MAADLSPGHPGPRERLGNLILGEQHVASAGGNRPQARIPTLLEELGERRLVSAHNPLTRQRTETLTSEPGNRMIAGCRELARGHSAASTVFAWTNSCAPARRAPCCPSVSD